MKVTLKWNKSINAIVKDKTGGKSGLVFLANEAKRLMDPYVPANNMVLAQNVRVYSEGNRGIVHYLSPYAHYQYEGKVYVDPTTGKAAFTNGEGLYWSRRGVGKIATGRNLTYNTFRHPLATSHWDKAMLTARKGDLVKAYENYLKGRKA